MYYTNYFEGIDIDNVIVELDNTISTLNTALNNDASTNILSSSWESDSKTTLVNALQENCKSIPTLIEKINSFKTILGKAKDIKTMQDSMKNVSDYATLSSSAQIIEEKIKELDGLVNSL